MTSPLGPRLTAEAVGTGFLVAAVIGSGIAAQRSSPTDVGLQLLENALATGVVLTALILALGSVSASFNPVVSVVQHLRSGEPARHLATVVGAQIAGGVLGAVVANLMFDRPAVTIATTDRSGAGTWLAEVVATTGLVLVIIGTTRAGRRDWVAVAVGGYIAGVYWFTSSTGFANPAVTVARTLSDTFAGISPSSVPWFVLAQVLGGLAGYLLARALFPAPAQRPDVVPAAVGVQETP
jgi:glycerol uptake facilitator-like aquaporin